MIRCLEHVELWDYITNHYAIIGVLYCQNKSIVKTNKYLSYLPWEYKNCGPEKSLSKS